MQKKGWDARIDIVNHTNEVYVVSSSSLSVSPAESVVEFIKRYARLEIKAVAIDRKKDYHDAIIIAVTK